MTFMFLLIILGATDARAPAGFAPLAIGLGLTLIHLISIPVTNTSVNPARSTGPGALRRRLGARAALAVLGGAARRRRARGRGLPGDRRRREALSLSSRPARSRPGSRSARRCPRARRAASRRRAGSSSRRGAALATERRAPGASCPWPWGRLTTPRIIASLSSTGTSTAPTRERTRARPPAREAEGAGVLRVHEQRAALLALRERGQVVHPRVVRAQVAASDQHEGAARARARRGRARGAPRRRRAGPERARSRRSRWRASPGSRGARGPRSTPCSAARSFASESPDAASSKRSP